MPNLLSAALISLALAALLAVVSCHNTASSAPAAHNKVENIVAEDGTVTKAKRLGYLRGCPVYLIGPYPTEWGYQQSIEVVCN